MVRQNLITRHLASIPKKSNSAQDRIVMAKIDTLKTAKRVLQAIEMATDGYGNIKDKRKAYRKERQKGRKIIKEEIKIYEKSKK